MIEVGTKVVLVDVGNSLIKTTEVFSNEKFGDTIVWKTLPSIHNHYNLKIPFMVSSVKNLKLELFKNRVTHLLSHKSNLPISLDYHTPETLGADRIAGAVGACEFFPNKNNLIVDIGTCMTIDLIDSSKVYRGGIISPGLQMRMMAMNHYTDQLPDISEEWQNMNLSEIGKTTKECLLSGSFWSMIYEIKGRFQEIKNNFTSLNMLLTGGDAHFFESKLQVPNLQSSELVQKGLYKIWNYQSVSK